MNIFELVGHPEEKEGFIVVEQEVFVWYYNIPYVNWSAATYWHTDKLPDSRANTGYTPIPVTYFILPKHAHRNVALHHGSGRCTTNPCTKKHGQHRT